MDRFLIVEREGGKWVASVYADEFRPYDGVNSFTGAQGGHFYIGEEVVATVEFAKYNVVSTANAAVVADGSL